MKKVLGTIVNVLAWIVLIFALLITILVFTSERNNGVPNLFGIMPMSVESDSMSPTFKKGDLIFVKQVDLFELNKDDVITFYAIVDGNRIKNTHRIIEINEFDGGRSFITRGDNNPVNDENNVNPSDIIGKWTGTKLAGFGNVLSFLRSKTGFFICIVIPMAIFFLFELYKFIVVLIQAKKPKISEEDEEAIKRKAIEEYLAKEKAEKEAASAESNTAEDDVAVDNGAAPEDDAAAERVDGGDSDNT